MMIVNNVLNVNCSEKEEISSQPVDMIIEFFVKERIFMILCEGKNCKKRLNCNKYILNSRNNTCQLIDYSMN